MKLLTYKKNSALFFLALLFLCLSQTTVQAQRGGKNSKNELENRKKKIAEEIKRINSMLNETRVNRKTSIGALVSINIKLEKRQGLINTINAQIQELNAEIAASITSNGGRGRVGTPAKILHCIEAKVGHRL